MSHTRATVFLLSLAFCSHLYAQQAQKLNIEQATVFLSGAELKSTAQVSLNKGENELVFTNVAGNINTGSLAVGATNGVVVTSAVFGNNYLAPGALTPRAASLKDSIETLRATQDELDTKIEVLKEQVAILFNNQKISGDNTGLNVGELTKMLDLLNTRMAGYITEQKKQEHLLSKTNERLRRLNNQLAEEQKKGQPGGQITVKLYSKEATTSNITTDYVIADAGWMPIYDVMADNTSSPVRLMYKAMIFQNCGVKWNSVHLVLSTGNPQNGMQYPEIQPWHLDFEDMRMFPEAVLMKHAARGVTRADTTVVDDPATSDMITTAVDNAGINTTFDVDLPYTIPSDGQQHLVAIKKYDLPATYCYYTVPKLDRDAFLQTQITNWQDLNLLPGKTNVFYEGTYAGQGYIDARNTKDTLTLSLGRDKKIIVQRDRDVARHSVKTIGNSQRETFAYTVTIRNTRKETINLIVQDQAPVSNDKDIVIEDVDNPGATYDETTGALKWILSLAPNETRKLTFGYTVRYPKGKTIANLR